jgi:hypothetical protein
MLEMILLHVHVIMNIKWMDEYTLWGTILGTNMVQTMWNHMVQ